MASIMQRRNNPTEEEEKKEEGNENIPQEGEAPIENEEEINPLDQPIPKEENLQIEEEEIKKEDSTKPKKRKPTKKLVSFDEENIRSSLMPQAKSIEVSQKSTVDESMNYYYCPHCKEVPKITMEKDSMILLECRCKNNGIHKVTLPNFINEIEKQKETPNCNMETKHPSPVNSTKYCPECKKFFCDACIVDHDNFNQHKTINCNGMILNSLCENESCKSLDKIEFFCLNCKIHLCSKCKTEHKKKHQIINLNELVNEKYISKLEDSISEIEKNMLIETAFYKEAIDLEKTIENCKKLINERISENESILKYFKSLINTYKNTKDIPTYNIRNNTLSSDIKKIYSFTKIHFRYKLKSEIVQSKLYKFLYHVKNYYNIINEYDIKSKEEVQEINKELKEKDRLKDYVDYLRILGYDYEKKTESNEFNQENCLMLIDDTIVPFMTKFPQNISPGKHKVELITRGTTNQINSLKGLFENCKSLISSDMSNYDSSSVNDMKSMYSNCHFLSSLNLKNLDTALVSDMKGFLNKCKNLTSVDFSYFDTSKVTEFKYFFNGCNSLTSLNLWNFVTSSAVNMKGMFNDCSSLTELCLSNFDTSNVEDMKQMFHGCSKLVSLDISNFDTTKVNDMEEMFYDCEELTELKINSESKVKKMKDIFHKCDKLDQTVKDKFKKK
ncbi:MAG: BspA family leucine-rich repeat surface protein, partial [archaeon]|nr:BspA family leucine-rich repeat surface protein [archaeon]